jgi:transposase
MKRTQKKNSKKKSQDETLTVVNPNAAGIDIGSAFHYVAVPKQRADEPVQKFSSFTNDLYRLANWLKSCGVDTVAMESTGVYWIPLYEILEARGFEVLLVNAHHVKNVPGRKTDVLDCQWIQQLHSFGLLRGSFRPEDRILPLRGYMRQREQLVDYAASHIQHMQKALLQMNIQLHKVISDITGTTGMAIVREIVSGNYDPQSLAKHRDPRCKASVATIVEALTGNYRIEHLFALKQALELYDQYQLKIRECDAQIEAELKKLAAENDSQQMSGPGSDSASKTEPQTSSQPPKHKQHKQQKNHIKGDIHLPIIVLAGVDLGEVVGMSPTTVVRLLSEIGTDMSRWPTKKHFTSWLTLAPNNKITGGKVFSSKTRSSANRAAKLLRLVAVNVGRTQTALGAFYRRMCRRTEKAKAVTATARKLAELIYTLLKKGREYVEPGMDYYEQRYHARVLKNLSNRAKKMGYELVKADSATELKATA